MKLSKLWALVIVPIVLLFVAMGSVASDQDVLNWDAKFWTMEVKEYDGYYSFPRIVTTGVVDIVHPSFSTGVREWKTSKTSFRVSGSAFVVRPGVAITAAHCVQPAEATANTKWGPYTSVPLNVTDRIIRLYNHRPYPIIAKLYHIDTLMDVAILKFDVDAPLKPMPYEIFTPVTVRGVRLAVVVHDRLVPGVLSPKVRVKYGIVAHHGIDEMIPRKILPWLSPWDFSMGIVNIQPGDSGSPVFMMMCGKPVCVGIVRAIFDRTPLDGECDVAIAGRIYFFSRYLDLK